MIPLDVFGSESLVVGSLQQVRWHDGAEYPRCRFDRTIRNGSYGTFQRYLCKNCDHTFNDKTGTIFAHSKVALRKWLFSIYAFLRFNTSLRQPQREIGTTYKTTHRRAERFARMLDAPRLDLVGSVEIDKVYISAGLKGREHDSWPRSRGLPTRGQGSYKGDKPPVFTTVDREMGRQYAVPAKSADGPTVRLLLADHKEESLTIYTDGFRAYSPLEDDNEFTREYVVHGDGKYADEDVHANSCEGHVSLARRRLSPHRGVSKDKLTQYLRASQLRGELLRKPDREALKHAVKATL